MNNLKLGTTLHLLLEETYKNDKFIFLGRQAGKTSASKYLYGIDFAKLENKVITNLINQKEENIMSKVYNKTVWIDGSGRERDVKTMSDDHIMNCIALLQKRKNLLNDVEWSFKAIEKAIQKESNNIAMFVDEMLRRETLGIVIED